MRKILFAAGFAALIVSCEKKNNQDVVLQPDFDSTAVASDSALTQEPITTNCYINVSGKDSLLLSYEDNLGTITGKMNYKNFEKDSSKGDISGLMNGDTLKVVYTFEAEGTTSNREIWFLKKDKNLVEGIGNYDESGENYADGKSVKFEKGAILTPVDCKKIEKYLK